MSESIHELNRSCNFWIYVYCFSDNIGMMDAASAVPPSKVRSIEEDSDGFKLSSTEQKTTSGALAVITVDISCSGTLLS